MGERPDGKIPVDSEPHRLPLKARLLDEARFIKNWVDKPMLTGAISPSGRVLSAKMAAAVDINGTDPIIELGPGTGPVTQALLDRGISPERLVLIEFNPDFCKALSKKYPQVRVIEGDAYAMRDTLAHHGITRIGGVVSSLPLLTRPEGLRLKLLIEAFDLMDSAGAFVQFTYGLNSPIPLDDEEQQMVGLHANVSEIIWNNLPPARVWTYRPCDRSKKTFDKEMAFGRFMREHAEKWREDRHIKPALAFLKRIGDHFDKDKLH